MIAAAQAGDRRAREQLVGAYLPLVYNIAGRALHGHADVDDVVQETMLRALNGLGALRDPGSFRSWLVAVTMNQIRTHWQWRSSRPESGLQEADDPREPGGDFVELTILRLGLSGQRREAAEATRWLDEEDRALLSLWWLEAAGELSRSEVARAMELSPQHTAVRVQRMKERLEASRTVVRALAAGRRCPALSAQLATWDGRPTALWRKRLARHTRECAACARHSDGLMPAEGLLAGLALVPPAAGAGAFLVEEATPVGAEVADLPGPEAAAGTGPRGRHGSTHRLRRRRRTVVAVSTAAALVAAAGTGAVLLDSPPGSGTVAPAAAPAPETPATQEAEPTESAEESESPSPSPSASASDSPSPEPSTSSSSAEPPPSPSEPAPASAAEEPSEVRNAAPDTEAAAGPAQQVVTLLNRERAENGCGAVRSNSLLAEAAQRHSEDMATRDYFSHTSPDGSGPGERITAAGYPWSTYGENIARGQQSPSQVMKSWMDSPGHRANIVNCDFEEVGIGVRQGSGGPWWTQNFGAR